MVVYSIKDIENICGIKAHTLRVWEKRYSILIAKRTETTIRYYTEEDLKLAEFNTNSLEANKIESAPVYAEKPLKTTQRSINSKLEARLS